MTRLTGIILASDGLAFRAVVPGTPSGARGRQKPKEPGLRWALSARRTSLRRLPDGRTSRCTPRLAERADLAHQAGHYLRWSVLAV